MSAFTFASYLVNTATVTLHSPLQLLQIRMQCRNALHQTGKIDKKYTNPWRAVLQIRKEEGIKGFFKGNLVALMLKGSRTVSQGMYNGIIHPHVRQYKKEGGSLEIFFITSLDPFIYMFPVLCVTYPLEFARIRLANNGMIKKQSPQFLGIRDLFQKVWANQGFRGFYRGMGASMFGIYAYRTFNRGINTNYKNQTSFTSIMIRTTGASVLSSILAYPFDTAKKRMMMTSLQKNKFSSTWGCMNTIIKKQGFKALYHGFSVNLFQNLTGAFIIVGYNSFRPTIPHY